jgi:hypothetical protein
MVAIPSPGTTGNHTIITGDGGDTLCGDPFDVSPLTTGRGGNDRLSATGEHNDLFGDANEMWGDGRGGNHSFTIVDDDRQIWRFEDALAQGQLHDGHDRLYVPRKSHVTGDLDVHDLAVDGDGRLLFEAQWHQPASRAHRCARPHRRP